MTLQEAIKILEQLSIPPEIIFHSDDIKAAKLGILALKRWKERHDRCPDDINFLLPGETETEPQPTREEVKKYMADRAST